MELFAEITFCVNLIGCNVFGIFCLIIAWKSHRDGFGFGFGIFAALMCFLLASPFTFLFLTEKNPEKRLFPNRTIYQIEIMIGPEDHATNDR